MVLYKNFFFNVLAGKRSDLHDPFLTPLIGMNAGREEEKVRISDPATC